MTDVRPDHARELRFSLVNPFELCERLGLLAGKGSFVRQARGVIIRCPWHEEKTPSCSVRIAQDGTIAARCHGCQAGGDALSLIAAANKLSTKSDFREVLRLAADIAGRHDITAELDDRNAPVVARPAPTPPPAEPERAYPPRDEVVRLWDEGQHVVTDAEAMAWVRGRGLSPHGVDGAEVARVISPAAELPAWARYQGATWAQTGHRLIFAMHDATGEMRSVRACRIVDGESPKRLPPAGHKASGLVMVCPLGVAMLRGKFEAHRVVVSEGEPDFLIWASRTGIAATVRVGIVSGSWSLALASKFAPGVEVAIRTDPDDAGDRYAKEIGASLQRRGCHVRREPRTEATT